MILQQENNIISRKKIINIHIICLAALVALIFFAYIGISIYYTKHFAYNTWINGYYCTGLTSEEALALVSSDDVVPTVTVVNYDGTEYLLDMSEVEFSYEYGSTVEDLLGAQTAFTWPEAFNNPRELRVNPIFTIAEKDLRKTFEALDFVAEEINRKPDYKISYSAIEGKYIYTDNLVHRFDYDKAFNDLYTAVMSGKNILVIDENLYYKDYEPDDKQLATMAKYERIDAYQNCDLVYDMGAEKIQFTPELALSFLVMEDGYPKENSIKRFEVDEQKVIEWVENLCEEYDTFEKIRHFQSTRGDIVEVEGGTYGTLLNPEPEIEYLKNNLLSASLHDGIADVHVPEYLMTAYARGKNDIGDTFIEVDLTQQHLYYYENGSLVLESDVVSGNLRTRNDTLLGTYSIISKEENRYIIGADFTSFVNYWMPYFKNYGLNDSTWRDEYGGEIYKTQGSHGTINLPFEMAEQLYEKIEPGIPIIVFY